MLSTWKRENSKMHVLYLNLKKKKGEWVERGAMQSFSLQFSPIPLSFPHPWVSILWLLVSEGLVSYHTQLSRISVYRKPIQYLWSSFVVFCVKVFFPVLFWVSFAIHCLCFLRLVYSAALTLGLAHLAPWIQSSDVPADARNTKAIEYLEQ